MKVLISYWKDEEKETRQLVTRELPIENISTIKSKVPMVEIALPVENDEVFITVPVDARLHVVTSGPCTVHDHQQRTLVIG